MELGGIFNELHTSLHISVRLISCYLNCKASALLEEIKQMNVFMKRFDCLTLNEIITGFQLVLAVR
jgi:hypothetical protein